MDSIIVAQKFVGTRSDRRPARTLIMIDRLRQGGVVLAHDRSQKGQRSERASMFQKEAKRRPIINKAERVRTKYITRLGSCGWKINLISIVDINLSNDQLVFYP